MDNFNIQNNRKWPKIIFAVLGVVLLIEAIYAVKVLTAPVFTPLPLPSTSVQPEKPGKISLHTVKTNYRVKDIVPVSVGVDTGSNVVTGIDLILRFDPGVLEATSGGIVKGRILDEYPFASVDQDKGLVSISGISSLKSGFKGSGLFARINFRAKAAGKTTLAVDFQQGSTTASNLVEASTAENILEQVDNLELEIQ